MFLVYGDTKTNFKALLVQKLFPFLSGEILRQITQPMITCIKVAKTIENFFELDDGKCVKNFSF